MAESKQKAFLYSHNGKLGYGIKKYIVDDASGIEELPTDGSVSVGSSCLVIATGDLYIMNSEHKWIKSSRSSGGGSDGGQSAEEPEALSADDIQSIFNEVLGE